MKEQRITKIINDISSKGSKIDTLKYIKECMNLLSKDRSLCEILTGLSEEVYNKSGDFLYEANNENNRYIGALSSSIYLPDSKNGEYELVIVGGSLKKDETSEVGYESLFDIDAITKLYTLILSYILEEKGFIDLNSKIKDNNSKYRGLGDFTFNDLIRMHGEIKTLDKIDEAKSLMEAYKALHSSKLIDDSRKENIYTDIGALIIGDTIEEVMSNYYKVDMSLNDIMKTYLFNEIKLSNTMFNPKGNNIVGQGYVLDTKVRKLGGCGGSAGIYTCSEDLNKLAKSLYTSKIINKNHLDSLGEITFPNSNNSYLGNLGTYVKNKEGLSSLSNGSFASIGQTGSLAVFDPNNMIHFNILTNVISDTDSKSEYIQKLKSYELLLTEYSLLIRIIKNYYNEYTDEKVDIKEMKLL